jgi:membrane-associated protease RseP (regulator of RpoE activity)
MSSDNPEFPRPAPIPEPSPAPRPVPLERVIVIPQLAGPVFIDEPPRPVRRGPRKRLALILFLLTCLSTFTVGFVGDAVPHVFDLNRKQLKLMFTSELRPRFINGFAYSACIMGILAAHEMGHYLQARRYQIPASPPFFIPLPISPFGTMGAVIVQQAGVADRKSMFDIAITGPLAGLVLALPVAYFGIRMVKIDEIVGPVEVYGDPLLLKWMYWFVHGPMPAGYDMLRNPVLFAGWVGVFVTGLNLVPIGQLDGGHILYCLIGRRAHYVARGLFLIAAAAVAWSVTFGNGRFMVWSLMLFLIWMMGTRHPPTANDHVPLGPVRVFLGWVTLMFIFIGLTPTPIYVDENEPKSKPPIHRNADEIRI